MTDELMILLLKRLNISLGIWNQERMDQVDITPAQSLMLGELLDRKEEKICSTDISFSTGFSKATISSVLKTLKKKGYLTMEDDQKDNRRKYIVLTKKAYEAEAVTKRLVSEGQERLCSGIPKDELKKTEEILRKMLANLQVEKEV